LLPSNDGQDAAAADRAQELAQAHTTPQADFVKTQQPEQESTPELTTEGVDDDDVDTEELGEPELVLELSDEWKEHFRKSVSLGRYSKFHQLVGFLCNELTKSNVPSLSSNHWQLSTHEVTTCHDL
jgi:hypothetical protein